MVLCVKRFEAFAGHTEEVDRQQLDVLRPGAQRRQLHRKDLQPVVEILAELAGGDAPGKIDVRGSNDAGVGGAIARLAHAAVLALLQDPVELHLQGQRHVPDLVEKERSAVGFFQQPALVLRGPGEGALGVTKQLGLQQLGGERTTVDGDKRS